MAGARKTSIERIIRISMTTLAERIMRIVHYGTNIVVGVALAVGCKNGAPAATSLLPPERTLGNVQAFPSVSILAVGGTQQLTVVSTSLTGVSLTSVDSVTYILNALSDSLRVRLTGAGLVTGIAPSTAPIPVNVFVFKGDIASADQVLCQVTAAAVPGVTLSIQPAATDSAKQAMGVVKTIVPVIRNPTTGASVSNPVIRYTVRPADAQRMGVYTPVLTLPGGFLRLVEAIIPGVRSAATPGQILPFVGQGSAWIYASVNAYGALLQDSVQYTFTYPYKATIATVKSNLKVTSKNDGQAITLAPGATVIFQSSVATTDPLKVSYTFDTPSAATAASPPSPVGGATGNITTLIGGQASQRQFLTPGTYRWTATASGGPAPWDGQIISGTIVIK